MEQRPVKIIGSVTQAIDTFESFKESKKDKLVIASPVYASEKKTINVHWLSAASSTYGISADIRDYIIPIIPIVTSDIPNRNLQAFSFEELSKFDWMKGHMIYQSFIGKMTAANHVNDDPSHARGVIFDASLQFVPKYDVWKVVLLCGFDRTKDKDLVRDILSRKRTGYSMGALVETFEPVVAGSRVSTQYGLVPIESIKSGTLVETIHGLKRSEGAIFSGYLPVVNLQVATGLKLDLALSHPVMVLDPETLTVSYKEAGSVAVNDLVGIARQSSTAWPVNLLFNYTPVDVEIDDNGLSTCAICNAKFGHIGHHVKAAHQMSTGEYLARYSKRVLNPKNVITGIKYPSEMTPELASLLGYFLSEGSYGDSSVLTGFSGNFNKPELWSDYEKCFKACFGDVKTFTLGIKDFLEHIGVEQGFAKQKHVPWSIMQAPRESVVAFIRAFWEGDGSARSVAGGVSFHTSSPQLSQDLQLLLLKLGIPNKAVHVTQQTTTPDGAEHDLQMYNIQIFGKHVDTFIREIGCTSSTRRNDLNVILPQSRQKTQFGEHIPGALEALNNLYERTHYGVPGNPYYRTTTGEVERLGLHRLDLKNNTVLSQEHFKAWPELLSNIRKLDPELATRLQWLVTHDIQWSEIVGKNLSPLVQPCYCIKNIEDDHHFFAEGYIVHNCSVCGQDRECKCTRGGIVKDKLVYQLCKGVNYIETSSVESPADITAIGENLYI
jgi:hypothetical protein